MYILFAHLFDRIRVHKHEGFFSLISNDELCTHAANVPGDGHAGLHQGRRDAVEDTRGHAAVDSKGLDVDTRHKRERFPIGRENREEGAEDGNIFQSNFFLKKK